MALPALVNGKLPRGAHKAEFAEFWDRFVQAITPSQQRPSLGKRFKELREETDRRQIPAVQWVGGSYVTDKLEPSDVDVVTFIDYAFEDGGRSGDDRDFLYRAWSNHYYQHGDPIHSTLALVGCPTTDPLYEIWENLRRGCLEMLCYDRAAVDDFGNVIPVFEEKGVVELTLSNADAVPALTDFPRPSST